MNKSFVQSYLFFNGRCEEALKFYADAIGAKTEMLLRFKENPETPPPGSMPPNWGEKVMHASFRIGETVLMASDGCETSPAFAGFSLSLSVASEREVDQAFNALAAGGKVTMPLARTFWSPRFGMLTDKFGVGWMVGVIG